MVRRFDHLTVVVRDVSRAKAFFGVLGFQDGVSARISGEPYASYMGLPAFEADHVTLVLPEDPFGLEVQLLHVISPEPEEDPGVKNLARLGLNHVCFEVEDVEETLQKLQSAGFAPRNKLLHYRDRKLIFVQGPEGITVELSQRMDQPRNGA
jgi:catechol 2,3-dioxygenase-like lactoylglutathione lyase family enzyme